MLEVFKAVAPIFALTFIGFIFGRCRKVDLKTLADFIIYLGAPALVFINLAVHPVNLGETARIALSAVFVILALGLTCRILFKSMPTGLYLPIMFMNSGFFGYPITIFALGSENLYKTIIFDLTNAVLIFSVGILIVGKGGKRWEFLKLPFLYAAIAGIAVYYCNIHIPISLFSTISMLGNASIPIALFMLGSRLSTLKINSFQLPLLASALRLIIGPALGFLAVQLFRLEGTIANVIILTSGMPSAVTAISLAEEYDADSDLVASTIALCTVLSVITIPILLKLLHL